VSLTATRRMLVLHPGKRYISIDPEVHGPLAATAELLKKASKSGKSQTVHISSNEFQQAAELRKHGGVGPKLDHVDIFDDLKQP
jgi:hypothetical protein